MSLWDWSLSAWARPGVEAAALRAQDERGQSIALILWLAYAGPMDETARLAGSRLATQAEAQILTPLRQARRALKAPPEGLSGAGAVCDLARQAELAAERSLLESLEALAGSDGDQEEAFARLDATLGLS